MIRDARGALGALVALLLPLGARAQDADPAEAEEAGDADPLEKYRVPFDVLADRAIGTTSRPSEFDWRASPVELAVLGSFLFELNNFDSGRGGLLARVPSGGLLFEVGVSYVGVFNTPSSRLLSLTPYRQPGRPERMEIDFTVGLPLAEGVVTAAPRFFPAAQMAFVGYVGLRYGLYPTGFRGMRAGQIAGAAFSPQLTGTEIANLDGVRLGSMEVDPGRYGLVVGFGDDVYFSPGLFLSPRVMFSLPLLAPASGTQLRWWGDVSLAVGWAL
ncbi:MAG: hypothetical protein R3F59_27905 [Myxococcota bacterium]